MDTDYGEGSVVIRAPFLSDHRPVTVLVKYRYIAPKKEKHDRYDVERLNDWPSLERHQNAVLDQLLPPDRQRPIEMTVTHEDFTEAVLKARDSCVPKNRAEIGVPGGMPRAT